MLLRSDIQIRDPFVFVENGKYYLYGTTDLNCWHGKAAGFDAYVSDDLMHFEPMGRVFTPSDDFWGKENFWAPELHKYRDAYYLFASFKAPGRCRATSILKADNPLGPFLPWGTEQATPDDWECLDGTLYVDTDGLPWIVFCHEWVQEGGGTVCARRLKEDLSGPMGDAQTLFAAKDAVWTKKIRHSSGIEGHVTDGPFLYKPENGQLWLLWSSMSETGYAIGLSISESGSILGPWRQNEKALFSGDGGHGMVFKGIDSILRLAIHMPNHTPDERPIFLPVLETADGLVLA
jgi:beta-xylosidase